MIHKHDVIVVGGGVAGVNAAAESRWVRPSSSVALVADESTVYSRPSLTAAISGLAKSVDDVTIYSGKSLKDLGITTCFSSKAVSIDPDSRTIVLRSQN